jgi:glycosyltransferase involved in cell wall biosynthesis
MSTSRNIAIISPVFPPYRGGIGEVAKEHARLLSEHNFKVSVFTPDYEVSQKDDDNNHLYKVIRVKPFLKYGNAAWIPSIASQLKDFDTVILHYPFFGGMKAVYNAKKKYDFKLITYYHMDVVAGGLKGLIFWYATKFFLPKIVKQSHVVLASSEDYAKQSNLGKHWIDNDAKFKILPIGVDINRFHPQELNKKENIVLFVGGLDKAHYFKGVEYLIKAIPLVELQAKFVIAGKGELVNEYTQLAKELAVSDKVIFTGGVTDQELVKLYQNAIVTVLPSVDHSEAFGIVLIESMACATPVIASDLPGVRSVFEHGVQGYNVSVRDVESIAKRIAELVSNPKIQLQMGTHARALVEQKYDWNKIGNILKSLV